MNTVSNGVKPTGLALALGWPRIRFVLVLAIGFGLLFAPGWKTGLWSIVSRTITLGLVALLVFGLFEQWPRRLPRWMARWVLQVTGAGLAMPLATFAIYMLSTPPGAPPFWTVPDRMTGFLTLMVLGLFVAPWTALAAVVHQKEALVRDQALAFELERSQLERRALDARLRLLQAQVAPHFLFNTLANVQALVEAGSPRAPAVLRSLVAYLRAAVPRLDEPATTLGREVELVRAYLELMHMRMPDRLSFRIHADPAALDLRCPPLTLLTLAENAIRHGIDPSEEGGDIEIVIERRGGRCVVRVRDSGVGLRGAGDGPGTGLATLRERLALAFAGEARLRVESVEPRGVLAEIEFPTQETDA